MIETYKILTGKYHQYVVPTAYVVQKSYNPRPADKPGQLSLLPSVGWEMSTGQSAAMLCGWGVKAGMAHSISG